MRFVVSGTLFAVAVLGLAGARGLTQDGVDPEKLPVPEKLPTPTKLIEPEKAAAAIWAEKPTFRILLGPRQGSSQLNKHGVALVHGGIINVTQPRPDAVIILMTGESIAAGIPCGESLASIVFDLVQDFQIESTNPRVIAQEARLHVEGQLVGMYRASRPGAGVAVTVPSAHARLESHGVPLLEFGFDERILAEGQQKLFINDHFGPVSLVVPCWTPLVFQESFGILSRHPPRLLFHRNVVYAAFGPGPSRLPEWVRLLDPAPEAPAGDLGFRVVLQVEPAYAPSK